ncbi:Hydrolase-4 domain-containing protein [Mycena chlorophos]|uniref:Hydrolase-4 domain-containing protein n=1 Tax=Mycena chlorophos TaxID=658473 RepID=A0A8H6SU72_MYCCL|nr:Hydrolase-4 domain-containing protein [Mycena chlorophos]
MSSTAIFSESWLPGPEDTNFYVRVYDAAAPRAAVVFLHGAPEHCGRYTDFHTALARDHNISVFAYDLRGYGRTAQDEEHKSPTARYGRTWSEPQMTDMKWAIGEARQRFPELPLFLMGTSFGASTILAFFTDAKCADPRLSAELTGVIIGSVNLAHANPPPAILIWILTGIAALFPWTLFPLRNKTTDLSRNKETGKAYDADELIGTPGSLKSISSIFAQGERVLKSPHNWPREMPVLFLHGDADRMAHFGVVHKFFNEIPADDKVWHTYNGGYHELHNEPDGIREKSLADIVSFIHKHTPSQT